MKKTNVKELTKKSLEDLLNDIERKAHDEETCDEYEQGNFNGITETIEEIREAFGIDSPDPEIYEKRGCKPGEPFDPSKYPAGEGCEGCTREKREEFRCEGCEVGFDDGEEE
jgi:hypothetical protein